MTLQQLFAALQNPNMVITIKEINEGVEEELTKIYVSGYEQLQSSLLARTVEKIAVAGNGAATVLLAATT